MRLKSLLCLLLVAHSSLVCAATPMGRLFSKPVKLRKAPEGADYDTQIVHHAQETLVHEQKATSKSWFRSKRNKQAHANAAKEHDEARQIALGVKEANRPRGYIGP
ncbi:uncharacterized protein FA14DRAFT_156509 [Meira miltonrushii]|uniref:Uncharacterized protein n=1 Tax=Meira miltonrushii TaxID=1280837 RepID=A0A316V8B6_9BASI|nr:uncharacterized protein FA14DRAFT_156509 [Meira miltonrushii]PWN33829.1 hypothetical protein FA14DRAFT_156509 [Meira miltonrushii]